MTMFWQEDEDATTTRLPPAEMVDLSFRIQCRALPVDHAHALSSALQRALPWLDQEPEAGIHLIRVVEGNGWYPPDGEALLQLSRRTRMSLRIPRARIAEAERLQGQVLDVAGHELTVGASRVHEMAPEATLFAHHVVMAADEAEEDFLGRLAEALRTGLDIRVRKMMAGRAHVIHHPDGDLATRSVMVADLAPDESLRLQCQGIGPGRKLGCGLFVVHKGIEALSKPK